MRVIAGERRGMVLETPGKTVQTRPTLDRTKEAVLNILQPVPHGGCVLDLFAGTGQMGIEFLSRGMGRCVFSEKSGKMAQILRKNLEKTRYADVSVVMVGDFRKNLERMDVRFDVVYLDPPFYRGMVEKAMVMLRDLALLNPHCRIVAEQGAKETDIPVPEGYVKTFERLYSNQWIRIYQEKAE